MVAQQILSILTALSQKIVRFVFEGSEIKLVHTCGIFITMNPGYAGRTELPDNLKSMFRPISMMVPDSSMIAEINLFCEGFEGTRILARKVSHLAPCIEPVSTPPSSFPPGIHPVHVGPTTIKQTVSLRLWVERYSHADQIRREEEEIIPESA